MSTVDEGGAPAPLVPDYQGPGLSTLSGALMAAPGTRPAWVPEPARSAAAIVLFLVDGLGWHQLRTAVEACPGRFPTLAAACDLPSIVSVAPSTTAAALTSLAFGAAPGIHGMVGYKIAVDPANGPDVLNALRWRLPEGDAREQVPPEDFLEGQAFGGARVATVSRSIFEGSGFTRAAFADTRPSPWITPSAIAVECRRLLREGETFIYAYYEGLDTIAHAKGLGEHYLAELQAVDRLVADLASCLPERAALIITADHGQVEVGEKVLHISQEIDALCSLISGEGRFRWFHARPGSAAELESALRQTYGAQAWVRTVDEVAAEGWMGPIGGRASSRLGDVVVAPHQPISLISPSEIRDHLLVCRHGSLTRAEMEIPLLALG